MITGQRVRARAAGIYFGWWIVAGAGLIQVLQSGLLMQAYGVYVPLLRDEFGWSATALAVAFSLLRVESGLLGPLQGWMLDRWGPRTVIGIGMVILGLGFMAFSQINSLATFYAVFLFMAIGASMGGFMSLTTTVVNWFERRRAQALSFTQIGSSMGGMTVPLVAFAMVELGWRTTAFASGVIVLVIGFPLSRIMRHTPEQYGYLPDGISYEQKADRDALRIRASGSGGIEESLDFTARQALRTRAFWLLGIGHALAVVVVSAVTVYLVVHLNEGLGFSLGRAASIVALLTAITAVGQVLGGFLGDRFSKRLICTIAMFGHAFGLLALAYANSMFWVVVFTTSHGLAWGLRGPLLHAIRADYFGRASFGQITGFSSMIIMSGTIAGPIIAGLMADHFGNYKYGFTVLALMAALGSIFIILSTRPTHPSANRRSAP